MRTQDEKIKGFNLLELIVVVVIIGVISAVGIQTLVSGEKIEKHETQ